MPVLANSLGTAWGRVLLPEGPLDLAPPPGALYRRRRTPRRNADEVLVLRAAAQRLEGRGMRRQDIARAMGFDPSYMTLLLGKRRA